MAPVLESLNLQDSTAVDMSLNALQIAGAVFGVFLLLYGLWYPHARSDRAFVRALLNQT